MDPPQRILLEGKTHILINELYLYILLLFNNNQAIDGLKGDSFLY